MEHWAKKIFRKNYPKHVQNTFGHFWERFRAFLQFLKNFDFFENFRRLDPPWNNGQKNFSKNRPKTCSKHVWTLLGTVSGIFEIFKNFRKFSKTRPSMEHWAKKFFRKNYPKLKFLKIFDLFENFRRLDPPWNTGQKKFFEKKPNVWTLLGTISGIFAIFKKF